MNKPTKFSASEAGIDPQIISKNALKVVEELQRAGYLAYLVGGCARDLILGMKPKDFDVATDARPDQIKRIFRNSRIIGRRFKIVHVRFGYEVIEVATFRANASDRENVGSHEMTEGDQGQLLRDNVYGSIEEDVVRRDFRVNALYYDPIEDEVLDFVGGMDDIEQRKLISIGEPEQRFREDPVRMLRVVRFAAKLGFSMEPEALKMIEEEGKLLAHVSSARLFEEVLKLFHGGAAYQTFLMLRKYGLFKYLFPFTDQCIINDVEGMPERALKNTDKRIAEGKPVIPAFLFACMMWDPVKADAQVLMQDGTPETQAWRIAMNDGLRDQNQYVAVPRRLAEIILDIWNIHFRLIKRNPRMIKASLSNRRFRAAYDFLLLRVALHEVDQDIGEWWTRIQEVDAAEKEEMIVELGQVYKNQRQGQGADGETNGNSINYNERQPQQKKAKSGKPGNARTGPHRKGQGRTNKSNKRGVAARAGASRGRRSSGANRGSEVNGNGNHIGNNGNTANQNSNRNRRGAKRSAGVADNRYQESRPQDDLGHFQRAPVVGDKDQKKVKVRRKRRVVGPLADSDTDNNPHF
ncbi:MAG: polynucleotide adenylyltransferase PcnB [Gammaproteobacteria bacterium]|nr:polynucleotide adenylyltransferase PcnB [Gammaproteobacteria bacterium]